MPCICYVEKNFSAGSREVIAQANEIVEAYQAQDLVLTLRQLYYRFVASDLIPNTDRSYKRLGSIINDARLAGEIDWNAIEDRGRNLIRRSHWSTPGGIISSAAASYAIDKWKGQDNYVEVWVEKQALEAIIDQACEPLDVNCIACKGYMSQSEMWRASIRYREMIQADRTPVIIHLGDHDPSGLDMTRDIQDRLEIFGVQMEVNRIALNMDQVEEFDPPPNPAKLSDSRAAGYITEFGSESWELDALEPAVLRDLIRKTIRSYLNKKKFKAREQREESERNALEEVSDRWNEVVEFLEIESTDEED